MHVSSEVSLHECSGSVVARLRGHRDIPDGLHFDGNIGGASAEGGDIMDVGGFGGSSEGLVASTCNSSEDMSVIVYSTNTWQQVASFKFEEDVSSPAHSTPPFSTRVLGMTMLQANL